MPSGTPSISSETADEESDTEREPSEQIQAVDSRSDSTVETDGQTDDERRPDETQRDERRPDETVERTDDNDAGFDDPLEPEDIDLENALFVLLGVLLVVVFLGAAIGGL